MGKHDFLTPKAISNRMKAKGLQKLRWFCQVCQKQCRDENGFKCHTTSESHQRQMLIVANNPDKFLSGYSEMFEQAFLENLRRRHGTKRMQANVVYNEYISDKLHVHMNATQWTTLGSFVQYLGRTGKCVVDETEKGWFIQYIDRDPRAIARQEELEKKKKADLDHEERNRAFLERQLKIAQEAAAAKKGDNDGIEQEPTQFLRRDGDTKISLSLDSAKPAKGVQQKPSATNVFETASGEKKEERSNGTKHVREVDALMAEDERRKRHRRDEDVEEDQRLENWITKGIVVKVLNKKVADGKYYKQKGEVIGVKDKFAATVEMLESGDVLQLDQDDLETVIPKIGRQG
ncbi:hypothetical protein ATCC90586_006549 [Pythium insidiosum]|nr:hypothetical protein ATCC90586_006549 [Pythium insidiosum]